MSVVTRCVNGVCTCVLPIEKNDYRPFALRHKPLAAVSALLITAKLLALTIVALVPTTAELSTITNARIVQLTNAERTAVGLNELTVSPQLAEAARQKGEDMLEHDYFAHISPSGVTPWFWMNKVGYTYQVAGENLAIDFVEAEDVVAAWLASPSHKENMLLPSYTETGVATVTGEYQGGTSTIVVHMFGLPTGTTPSPSVQAETTTPTPTPSPSATPPPATPAPDTTPPRTPRIAAEESSGTIQTELSLTVEGDAGSTIHLLVNNTDTTTVAIPESGTTIASLNLTTIPDGSLTITAYATDNAGNQSPLSNELALVKDATGPTLADSDIRLVLSPATDQPAFLLTAADHQDVATLDLTFNNQTETYPTNETIVIDNAPAILSVILRDAAGNGSDPHHLAVAPQFSDRDTVVNTAPPARFARTTRWITAAVIAAIIFLLLLTVLIKVRIQRPALIAHASFVLLLGLVFLFI